MVVVINRPRRRWPTLARAWAPLAAAVIAAVIFLAVALSFVDAVYPAPVNQTLKYELVRSGIGISFGLTAPAPMAVGQQVTLTWFYFGKYPFSSNTSVWNPVVSITSRYASGAIVVNWTHFSIVGAGGGANGGPAVYVPPGARFPLEGTSMGGALFFQVPGPQVINVTMVYEENGSTAAPRVADYSVIWPQPQDTIYIETADAITNLSTTTLTLKITVGVGVFFAVITAAGELTALWDRARRITRGK